MGFLPEWSEGRRGAGCLHPLSQLATPSTEINHSASEISCSASPGRSLLNEGSWNPDTTGDSSRAGTWGWL